MSDSSQQPVQQAEASIEDSKEAASNQVSTDELPDMLVTQFTKQELVEQISQLSSPTEIATFIMGMNFRLEAEKRNLQVANAHLELRNKELSKEIIEYKKPGTSFTCFAKLPAEIRSMIWKYAEPEARFIQLKWNDKDKAFHCPGNRHPDVLHVCKEARAEILEKNPLCAELPSGIPRFFNHNRDILYLHKDFFKNAGIWDGTGTFPNNIASTAGFDPCRLRFLALNCWIWDDSAAWTIYQTGMFPLLEEIMFIHPSHRRGDIEGPCNVIEWCEDDNALRWFYDGTDYEITNVGRKRQSIADAFTRDLNGMNVQVFSNSRGEEIMGKENPWKVTGKLPRIRMMRMDHDTGSIFKLNIQA